MDFAYPWQFDSRRSAVMATNGMVATSQPLAAQAGLDVLQQGGTAADAAVATAAVLGVVEPHMTGIGGDVFALVHADGDVDALNASGPAPAAADLSTVRERTTTTRDGTPVMPSDGGLPVTVPGALAGWKALLDRYGSRPLEAVLEPAIRYARAGVPVSEWIARQWRQAEDRIADVPSTASTFLPEGRAPRPGERFANPALAESLEAIAAGGPEVLYGGSLGEAVVDRVRDHGGLLAVSDLRAFAPTWTSPISTTYRGVEVLEHPPNGQGVVALEALNIAETFDLGADPRAEGRLHRLIEAMKAAFADGYEHVADPAVVDVPTERLASKDYAAERAAAIGETAAEYAPGAPTTGDDTVYLTVVDGDGTAVSFINSIYARFGSGLAVGGFALQNRGHSFRLDPDHANAIAPGKRPYHTIIPAMLREDGAFRASWGVMGGPMQPQGHLQVVSALVDAGLNPQAALDAPRFRWLDGRRIALETGRLDGETIHDLRRRGHRIVEETPYFNTGGHWGGGQLIYRTDEGTLLGGSDPRRDGAAVGW